MTPKEALPEQADHVEVHHRTNFRGERVTILKDPARSRYYRLSESGWFLWERLDGRHSLEDLLRAHLREFHTFSPPFIVGLLDGLRRAGFLKGDGPREELAPSRSLSHWDRWTLRARALMEWRFTIRNLDPFFGRCYRRGGRLLYTRAAQVASGLCAASGVIVFLSHSSATNGANLSQLISLIPALLLAIVLHELGHALTVKHFGREVNGAGVGWYWFRPIAFVDTSDMWLAGRWPRIAVSLAGPYANLVLAGASAIVARLVPDGGVSSSLCLFSLVSYLMVLVNLNPLLELDGYYVLMDLAERPNLRDRALAWIGRELPRALTTRRGLAAHWIELGYGLAALAYVGAFVAVMTFFYRSFAEALLTPHMAAPVAGLLAWSTASLFVVPALATTAGQLRGLQPRGGDHA